MIENITSLIYKSPLYLLKYPYRRNFIIQQYINHDERIYKVYVYGDNIQINQKQSTPNLMKEIVGLDSFFFDSQMPLNEIPEIKQYIKGMKNQEIDEGQVKIICDQITKRLDFTLFGVDILRETATGEYYIIDINYFPGFKGVPDLCEKLREHMAKKFRQFKEKNKPQNAQIRRLKLN